MSAEPGPAGETPAGAGRASILILAVAGGIALLILLLLLVARSGDGAPADEAVVTADAPEGVAKLALVSPQEVTGTSLLRMDVAVPGEGGGGYSSGGESDVRNILLIDKATGASRTLLPDNRRRVDASQFLPAEPSTPIRLGQGEVYEVQRPERIAPDAYFMIQLRSGATNEGPLDIVVGTLSGRARGTVMSGVDGVESVWMHSASRMGLIVREQRGIYYRIVDIPTLRVVLSRKIEIG